MDQPIVATLEELAANYGIKVPKHETSTDNKIEQLVRCIKAIISHEEQLPDASDDALNEEQVEELCQRLDKKMSSLKEQVDKLRQTKHLANQLAEKFMIQYQRYLEQRERHNEYLVNFHVPFERSKRALELAKTEFQNEIERLGSLEEKYQDRDKLAELRRLKEYLNKEISQVEREIQDAKIRIREYQGLDPNLLEEYKRLKSDLEMYSLLSQMHISSMSVD